MCLRRTLRPRGGLEPADLSAGSRREPADLSAGSGREAPIPRALATHSSYKRVSIQIYVRVLFGRFTVNLNIYTRPNCWLPKREDWEVSTVYKLQMRTAERIRDCSAPAWTPASGCVRWPPLQRPLQTRWRKHISPIKHWEISWIYCTVHTRMTARKHWRLIRLQNQICSKQQENPEYYSISSVKWDVLYPRTCRWSSCRGARSAARTARVEWGGKRGRAPPPTR